MLDQENGLPSGWALTTLGQVCKTTSGGTPSRKFKNYFQGDIPWVKSGELPDNFVSDIEEHITKEALDNSSAKLYPEGTLLIALYGATVGKLGILKKPAATNQAVCAIFPIADLYTKYLFWYLRFIRSHLISQAVGGAQPNINQGILQGLSISLAPLPEQHRIVAEIEKQFSRLDEAVAGLKRIQANLKRYRASVLKAAVEGKLTAEWRKQHPDTEPAEQLLQHILKERRAYWEQAELEKMQAAGKPPKDDQWKQKYKEPTTLDVLNLPGLPGGWFWGKLQLLTMGVEYGTSAKSKEKGDCPVLRMGNIQNYKFDWTDLVYSVDKEEIEKYSLKPNDVLFNRTNSPELVGKTAIYCEERPAIFAGYLIRINQIYEIVDAKFLNYFLNSNTAKQYGNTVKTDGVNQSNINGTKLINYPFPYCNLSEQAQIVSEIERRLSIADEVEQQTNTSLKRAELMRQSILKKAFSGRLVPQDLDDEPASVLLEKIKQGQSA